ncbi:DUF3140 domain-containing protein [uncultured Nocardioides sp.]|uniref:DUF3140 domain-containing protein n=1 Tax=uncultured Nocardioides sp. TaxID=198441 RepID=A0A6J4NAL5_9ACTN|nr:DUF3140 domain-containing protein [uncultured Nocardioides sp.]CAA9377482.1 MAG: FIG00833378: hypothetical protein [uncultured Nocardioides sp.]
MAETIVDDLLWENFHRVVNMTSRELRDWLAVEGAGEETETVPDQAGSPLGHRVLSILAKRRADCTPDDVETMDQVVEMVVAERGEELDSAVGDDAWRRGLMDIGHDPLKP